MTPYTYQPAGSLYSQGMSFGTPRDWSKGGMQYYDPQYVTPLRTEGSGTSAPWGPIPATNPYGGGQMQAPRVQATTTPAYNTISTGINVGPVMPQQAVQGHQDRLRGSQGPAQYAPYMQHLNSLLSNQMNAAATDFGRDAAYANAQQMLGSQQARARAGTGWGGVALQQYGNQLGNQQQALSALLSLLGQFGV